MSTTPNEIDDLNLIDDFKIIGSREKMEAKLEEAPEEKHEEETEESESGEETEEEEENDSEEEEENEEESGEVEDNQEESEEDGEDEYLSDDQVEDVIGQRFQGLSSEEIESRLLELHELKTKSQEPQFKSEKHKKAFEFINKYSGEDFGEGLAKFARISTLDISGLDERAAMKELFIQENPDLSKDDAIALFEHEYAERYDNISDETIAKIKLGKDGKAAKEKLAQLQNETRAVETEASVNDQVEQRNSFLDAVKQSTQDFNSITISDGENDLNFDFDQTAVQESLSTLEVLYDKMGWIDSKGKYDFEKMKLDYAFLLNKDAILQTYGEQQRELGKEELLRERRNSKPKGKQPESNVKGKVKTEQDAFEEAIMNRPDLRKR